MAAKGMRAVSAFFASGIVFGIFRVMTVGVMTWVISSQGKLDLVCVNF